MPQLLSDVISRILSLLLKYCAAASILNNIFLLYFATKMTHLLRLPLRDLWVGAHLIPPAGPLPVLTTHVPGDHLLTHTSTLLQQQQCQLQTSYTSHPGSHHCQIKAQEPLGPDMVHISTRPPPPPLSPPSFLCSGLLRLESLYHILLQLVSRDLGRSCVIVDDNDWGW